jgi:hypothetical protein
LGAALGINDRTTDGFVDEQDGDPDGADVGREPDCLAGELLGSSVDANDGIELVGCPRCLEGWLDGWYDGVREVGCLVGFEVGKLVGFIDGCDDGLEVGGSTGAEEGVKLGLPLGRLEGC